LALRNIRDTIAFLVDSEITHVTEEDHIAVLAFSIHAYATFSVLIDRWA
jgi:hypothetical protein